MASITFFDKENDTKAKDVVNMVIRNDLWYTQQSFKHLLSEAHLIEIFHLNDDSECHSERDDNFFVGKLTAETTYELWHQRITRSGQNVMEALPHCVEGVPKNLGKCRHGLYKCTCRQSAKSTHSTGNATKDIKATVPCKRFHMDFGFLRR